MTANVGRMSGNDWQEWANLLLAAHYGPTEYQKVPDSDRGDAGIEGFTLALGHAYQAYGCDEPISLRARYERQRDKMTIDVGKFIDNRPTLTRILGITKVSRWTLFVPHFDSKEIVFHAQIKTGEVLSANLPYVAEDFRVTVVDEDNFATARDQLLNTKTDFIKIEGTIATAEQIADWTHDNDNLAIRLKAKIAKIGTLRSEDEREVFFTAVLKWYIEGQEILEALRKHPNVWEKVIKAKSHHENYLAMSAITNGPSPQTILNAELRDFSSTIQSEAKQLSSLSAKSLVHEAVADWLIRCPLDFPGGLA